MKIKEWPLFWAAASNGATKPAAHYGRARLKPAARLAASCTVARDLRLVVRAPQSGSELVCRLGTGRPSGTWRRLASVSANNCAAHPARQVAPSSSVSTWRAGGAGRPMDVGGARAPANQLD